MEYMICITQCDQETLRSSTGAKSKRTVTRTRLGPRRTLISTLRVTHGSPYKPVVTSTTNSLEHRLLTTGGIKGTRNRSKDKFIQFQDFYSSFSSSSSLARTTSLLVSSISPARKTSSSIA